MIDDMIAVMRRISDLKKRFGLKRHNPEINLQNNNNNTKKSKSYLHKHNEAISNVGKPADKNTNSNIKIAGIKDQYAANNKNLPSLNAINNSYKNSQKNGIEGLMNILPGSIKEYSGGGSLFSPEILTKGMSIFNNLLKSGNIASNKEQNKQPDVYFNNNNLNKVDKISDVIDDKESVKRGIDSYLRNVE